MKNLITLPAILLFLNLPGCRNKATSVSALKIADSQYKETAAAYFTEDNKGNPVLCWTAADLKDRGNVLRYAIYNPEKNAFEAPVTVTPSVGTSISAESMNKVAFKEDGTAMAFYTRKFENRKNPYAGAIFYSVSSDKGKSWSTEAFLSSDTSREYGRNFFDVGRLKNGEIAAIWLDARFGRSEKGSALFFATSRRGKGFLGDICLSKSTCECCRTDLHIGSDGTINIAYRSIQYPPQLLGKQVRDIVYSTSADNGRTFSPAKVISHDNWAIEGCPHTGPSLTSSGNKLTAAWFTGAAKKGIYLADLSAAGNSSRQKFRISESGRHPQLVRISKDKLALVCEEEQGAEPATDHTHAGMHHDEVQAGSKIVLRIIANDGLEIQKLQLSEGSFADHHPVITRTKEGLLVAWTRNNKMLSQVVYTDVRLD